MAIYLLHFDTPYKHARHYLGFSEYDVDARIAKHRAGQGARLMSVIRKAGIGFTVARIWPHGTRDEERRLKRRGGAARICPVCAGTYDDFVSLCATAPEEEQMETSTNENHL